jgi:hypothetical protein
MKEIIIAAISFFIGLYIGNMSKQNTIQYRDRVIYDTLLKTIENKPIRIRTKPKIIYKRDTIIKTKPLSQYL